MWCRHSSHLAVERRRGRRDGESRAIPGTTHEVPFQQYAEFCHAKGGNRQPRLSLTHTHQFSSLQVIEHQVGNASCLQIFCVRTRVHHIQRRCLFRNENLLWLEDSAPLLQPVSIIRFKFLSFIVGFGCKQDPRSNAKGSELCFSLFHQFLCIWQRQLARSLTQMESELSHSKYCTLKRGTGMNGCHRHVPVTQASAWTFQLCHIWSCTCSFAITQIQPGSINQTIYIKFSTVTGTDWQLLNKC